jgi:hypothetical protein
MQLTDLIEQSLAASTITSCTESSTAKRNDNDLEEPNADVSSNTDTDEDADEEHNTGVKRWMVNSPPNPRPISKKRLEDDASFDQWIVQHEDVLSQKSTSTGQEARTKEWLVRDMEKQKIIVSPRDYQVELFEKAKLQNTIAVLDTGSVEKTFVLNARWMLTSVFRLREDSHRSVTPKMDYRERTREQSSGKSQASLLLPGRQGCSSLSTVCYARMQS